MILYLAGHSNPEIFCAVNCADMYMFCPNVLHELALNIIRQYLKATRDRGLVLNISPEIDIDYCPDYFSGIYGNEKSTDP